jgi:hypothetical protein
MLIRRKPKTIESPLVSLAEGARLLSIPLSTLRDHLKARRLPLTVVNLNDGLPEPVIAKNYLRLKRSEVLAIVNRAIEVANGHRAELERAEDLKMRGQSNF